MYARERSYDFNNIRLGRVDAGMVKYSMDRAGLLELAEQFDAIYRQGKRLLIDFKKIDEGLDKMSSK